MIGANIRTALLFVALSMAAPWAGAPDALAQTAAQAQEVDRSATGGAQTLEDILRRQRGEEVPLDAGTGSGPETGTDQQLGVQGSTSDSELWRRVRQGDSFSVSIPDKKAAMLVQDEGEDWLALRSGPLHDYTAKALIGTIILLALFMLLRGKIMIRGGPSGTLIERFTFLERFGHWLLAGSFIVLAITGLGLLFGRTAIIPALDYMREQVHPGVDNPDFGKSVYAAFAGASKWLHNYLSFAFIAGLVLVFFMWVLRNIPTWTDVQWLMKGGGLFSDNSHPHSKKFNAGQKLIFWSVVLLGASISASGLSLLFPYQLPLFAVTFEKLNAISAAVGYPLALSTSLTPIEEMQYAQSWHTIVSAGLICIVLAHIYIGSIGMQGAFAAMGSGKVDINWAREHHDLWVEELERKGELHFYEPGYTAIPATVMAPRKASAAPQRSAYEPAAAPAAVAPAPAPREPVASTTSAPRREPTLDAPSPAAEPTPPPLSTEDAPWPRPHSKPSPVRD